MSRRKTWLPETINGVDYYVNKNTGFKKIVSKCGRYLHEGPDYTHSLSNVIYDPQFPTLDDLFGCGNRKGFYDLLENIFVNKLNFTPQEFRANKDQDPPILNPLYPIWKQTRDPNWLYRHRCYAFETLHCNMQVTVKPGSKGDICDRHSTMFNTLAELELMDYHKKGPIKILDLCSGMGLSTLLLAKHFPNATVYYNELNPQTRTIFEELLKISGLTNVIMLNSEEIDEELDLICAFEAVEHIPHPTKKGVGQPFEWTKQFLDKLKVGGNFIYYTMWNAEFNDATGGNVLGHFLEYEIDGVVMGVDPNKNGGFPEWGKYFNKLLDKHGYKRLQGKTGCGYQGLKWSFFGSPNGFIKT